MELSLAFGRVLRAARGRAGLTQEKLGFEADLGRNYISMLELGQRQPTLSSLFRIADALGVEPAALVEETWRVMGGQADPGP